MEFWGAEVKSGEPLPVQPGDGMVLHLSQASLGELKKDKGSENVCLSVKIDDKKLVLGTLNSDKFPQQQFDLIFDKDFELSHNWKNGSVFFFGYRASNPFEEESDEDESDEDIPLTLANNGKPEAKAKEVEKSNSAKKVKIVEPTKDAKADAEDESSDEDGMSDDDEDDDSEMGEGEDASDEDESDDDSEEETPPKKLVAGKKRPADSATKTPVPDKKAKLATPQKTDGKKGSGHVDTPHPAKKGGKTPANKNQSPKSAGSHQCKPCNRSFGSESALEAHSKAKHSAGK